MKLIHFMYVPFTGLGLRGGYRGDSWLKNRIEIFKQYTLQSLLSQTNQRFILWISWRPEDVDNPIVEEFSRFLQTTPLEVIFTYGGVMFWDDKYEKDNLLKRFERTLPALKEVIGDAELVFMTIQPSDDMYLPHFVDVIQGADFRKTAGYREGYLMNYATKEISEYTPDTVPPFYTIKFPSYIFLNPKAHYDYIGPYKSHEYVPDHQIIPGRGFIVGTHGENISTTYQHPYKGRILPPEETHALLIATGTFHSDAIRVRRGARLFLRTVFNRIPFNDVIRKLYHKLPARFQYV